MHSSSGSSHAVNNRILMTPLCKRLNGHHSSLVNQNLVNH
jgi:hypothetical protein